MIGNMGYLVSTDKIGNMDNGATYELVENDTPLALALEIHAQMITLLDDLDLPHIPFASVDNMVSNYVMNDLLDRFPTYLRKEGAICSTWIFWDSDMRPYSEGMTEVYKALAGYVTVVEVVL